MEHITQVKKSFLLCQIFQDQMRCMLPVCSLWLLLIQTWNKWLHQAEVWFFTLLCRAVYLFTGKPLLLFCSNLCCQCGHMVHRKSRRISELQRGFQKALMQSWLGRWTRWKDRLHKERSLSVLCLNNAQIRSIHGWYIRISHVISGGVYGNFNNC